MLLTVEKSIRGGIWHAIYRYVKANNKYMKEYDKNKETLYFKYWDVNNLYGVHTKARNDVERAGTTWNKLERAGTSWNEVERAGTSWNHLE